MHCTLTFFVDLKLCSHHWIHLIVGKFVQESCHIICYYDRAIIVPLEKFIPFKKVILKNIFSISSLSFEITKTFKELALISFYYLQNYWPKKSSMRFYLSNPTCIREILGMIIVIPENYKTSWSLKVADIQSRALGKT